MGLNMDTNMEEDDMDPKGEVSNGDYESEDKEHGPWFSMEMMKEEKIEARKP